MIALLSGLEAGQYFRTRLTGRVGVVTWHGAMGTHVRWLDRGTREVLLSDDLRVDTQIKEADERVRRLGDVEVRMQYLPRRDSVAFHFTIEGTWHASAEVPRADIVGMVPVHREQSNPLGVREAQASHQ